MLELFETLGGQRVHDCKQVSSTNLQCPCLGSWTRTRPQMHLAKFQTSVLKMLPQLHFPALRGKPVRKKYLAAFISFFVYTRTLLKTLQSIMVSFLFISDERSQTQIVNLKKKCGHLNLILNQKLVIEVLFLIGFIFLIQRFAEAGFQRCCRPDRNINIRSFF